MRMVTGSPLEQVLGQGEVRGGGDLDVDGIPRHDPDGATDRLHQGGVVGRLDPGSPRGPAAGPGSKACGVCTTRACCGRASRRLASARSRSTCLRVSETGRRTRRRRSRPRPRQPQRRRKGRGARAGGRRRGPPRSMPPRGPPPGRGAPTRTATGHRSRRGRRRRAGPSAPPEAPAPRPRPPDGMPRPPARPPGPLRAGKIAWDCRSGRRATGNHHGPHGHRHWRRLSADGRASFSRSSAVSSSTARAKVSSETKIWRARLSIRFSPADRPLSLSRIERFRTTSATW